MSYDLYGFNAEEHEPIGDFTPLPAGWYRVVITESEVKPTKAQTGEYVQLRMEVIEGEHSGRIIFDRLNLENPSEKAVEFARRKLAGICRAVNVPRPRTTAELHDKPFAVKVKIRAGEGDYGPSNEPVEYAGKVPGGQVAKADDAAPPWKRRSA